MKPDYNQDMLSIMFRQGIRRIHMPDGSDWAIVVKMKAYHSALGISTEVFTHSWWDVERIETEEERNFREIGEASARLEEAERRLDELLRERKRLNDSGKSVKDSPTF